MTTINLRELYPWYTEDTFIEVSDEVAAFLEEDKRLQCCFSKRMRKVFKKNEKSMLQFCNKNSKKKRAFTMG